jgi:hypothetical protein
MVVLGRGTGADFERMVPNTVILLRTMTDACGIVGKVFDPRSEVSWEAAYKYLMAGRISATRTKPFEEKPKVNLERAEPTPAELRRAYFNDVVILWKGKRIHRERHRPYGQ